MSNINENNAMDAKDNYPTAVKLSEDTIEFLTQYEIAPTPINFSVVYHYLSKKYKLMNIFIDEHIGWSGSLDAVFLETVFIEFFSNTEQLEKSLISPFEQVLTNTLNKLKLQESNEKEIASSLQKADNVLAKSNQNASLQSLVQFINKTIKSSHNQHKILSQELADTYQQVQQLTIQLKSTREEAIRDALTGLYNRRGCDEKLKELPQDNVHTAFVIDIDHFKKINDSFGHAIGDNVLQKVAALIKDKISPSDFAVRSGGEEFIVVVANQALNEAKNIAEDIRLSITKLKLKQKKSNKFLPPISVSIGIAEYHKEQSWKSVFEMADSALYQAKSAGRNCCIAF